MHFEGHVAVRAAGGPGAGDPAEELARAAEDEDELPPSAGEERLREVHACGGCEEDGEGYAGGEGGGVAVCGRVGGIEGRAGGWGGVGSGHFDGMC